jgi:hypothetical protein
MAELWMGASIDPKAKYNLSQFPNRQYWGEHQLGYPA